MGFWVNPHGQSSGEGGGELPDVITWGMIEDKPIRFTPATHTHEMEEIINLEETISELFVMIDNRVKKIDGKGLSEEDFTTEYKNKVEQFDTLSTEIQTLSAEMDIKPSVKLGTNELEEELLSSKESNLKQPNLKNIVIVNSLEELNSIEPYQGLIAIISNGD